MGPLHQPGDSTVVLAIETSCDETGAALIRINPDDSVELLADELASSVQQHAEFGGVVPEIASRAHLEYLTPVVRTVLDSAGISRPDVVAATIGPGLAGALLVGVSAAKAYAGAWQVPFMGINHLAGHVAVDIFEHGPLPECIALLVSGGHTQLLHLKDFSQPITELGATVDDAAGEAYDKVARLLGVGYPGGPEIDRLARTGDPTAIDFPRGMTGPQDAPYDFSFSGLKTSVARYIERAEVNRQTLYTEDVAASFQEAVADVLSAKAVRACRDLGVSNLVVGGGVAANSRLRELLTQRCTENDITLRIPSPRLCTDNGAMIAAVASQVILNGAMPSELTVSAQPGLDVSHTYV